MRACCWGLSAVSAWTRSTKSFVICRRAAIGIDIGWVAGDEIAALARLGIADGLHDRFERGDYLMSVVDRRRILAQAMDVVGRDDRATDYQQQHQRDAEHQRAIELFVDTAFGIDHAQLTFVRTREWRQDRRRVDSRRTTRNPCCQSGGSPSSMPTRRANSQRVRQNADFCGSLLRSAELSRQSCGLSCQIA